MAFGLKQVSLVPICPELVFSHALWLKASFPRTVLLEMSFSHVLWLKAMKLTDSTAKIANLIFIAPILSLFLIHYLVGEEILISTLIGLALILVGLGIQAFVKDNHVLK